MEVGMVRETLRDKRRKIIGFTETLNDETEIILDKHGNRLGEYDRYVNVTRDAHGNLVGFGNLLAWLLP
jgi:hypothetical protein